MNINTNMPSINAQNSLSKIQSALPKIMAQLSSGYQINSAADNAAGLAIATTMSSDVRAFAVSINNANDGISMVQTADGAMSSINDTLQDVRALALQAQSGQYNAQDVKNMQEQADALLSTIDTTATQTSFNGQKLLDGSFSKDIFIGTGPGDKSIKVDIANMQVSQLGSDSNANLASVMSPQAAQQAGQSNGGQASLETNPSKAINIIDAAMNQVNSARSSLGALSNRFESSINNLSTASVNTQAATSRIMDTDYAQATSDLQKNLIKNSATISMLAQANVLPQNSIRLLMPWGS
ncbi:flagellin domain-containing protein [Candidatus Magnetobacterium bavaricum]|uniref:Flagellin n=1 Tax=Candidatus Magnetobacterium bavaricum TaxID=29290 RepID=A0A0F3GY14_9BACT|nr:flagellin domain-containing protein [Candidatus Magnetobacterium bavaricum]